MGRRRTDCRLVLPGPRQPWHRRHRGWAIGLGVFGLLVIVGGIANAVDGGKTAASTGAASVRASATAHAQQAASAAKTSPSGSSGCHARALAWKNSGTVGQVEAPATDFGDVTNASQQWVADASASGATPEDVSASQTAAGALQSDAKAVEAHPGSKEPGRAPRPRMRATYHRTEGVRHLPAAYEQASMIRRYIIWRNNHAYDERLRRIVDWASAACGGR